MTRHKRELGALVLALVILGVSLSTLLRKPAGSKPASGPKSATAAKREAGAKQAPQGGKTAAAPSPAPGGASRNPFEAPGGAPAVPLAPEEPPPGSGAAGSQATGAAPVGTGSQPGGTPPGGTGSPPASGALPGAVSQPAPDFAVEGVIIGTPSVAVISIGDRPSTFARVGDRIGDYRVQEIARQQVVLVGPTGKLVLRTGGSK